MCPACQRSRAEYTLAELQLPAGAPIPTAPRAHKVYALDGAESAGIRLAAVDIAAI
jgi:hypothetical protein